MNFRNKDLSQIFDEKYYANHNQKLLNDISNNKKQMADRMFGSNNNNKLESKKVIGYNNFNRK